MKQWYKAVVVSILGWQLRRLYTSYSFKTIGVVGSVGKTSTKQAIAHYIGSTYSVRYQKGNYNDIVSVPLVFFGLSLPPLYNPFAWIWRFLQIETQLWRGFSSDVVVVELGTDAPGQITQFAHYLHLDLAVISALTPEHMENFADLQAVADEELSVMEFADKLIINRDAVPVEYLGKIDNYQTYGSSSEATVQVQTDKQQVHIRHGKEVLHIETSLIGEHMHLTLGAAYAAAQALRLSIDQPEKVLGQIKAMPGRMRQLTLAHGAVALDDTYNASPEAVRVALDTLYAADQPRKIAVLGNMNELGEHSQSAHQSAGEYCDPHMLEELIVIGDEAKKYLAPAAAKRGVHVSWFDSPYAIADYLKPKLEEGVLLLFKGSQNKVFLEEAIKPLLQHPDDASRLVRQSRHWLKRKHQQFS